MMIWTRQSSLQVQFDAFMWTDDLEYVLTDEDYQKAKVKKLAVQPHDWLTTTWGRQKTR